MEKNIIFYFDFLSPYSYFAWKSIQKNLINTSPKSVLMGVLFNHFDFKGPGQIPPKRIHELKKCFQIAKKYNFEFNPPASHPFNPITIARMATSFAAQEQQTDIINKIFDLIWVQGKTLEDPDIISHELAQYQDCQSRCSMKEAKIELKKNIKEAINNNVFGVPTFRHQGENFWGFDSIEYLENAVNGVDDYDKEAFKRLLK